MNSVYEQIHGLCMPQVGFERCSNHQSHPLARDPSSLRVAVVERRNLILIALDKRGYAAGLVERIERLLDGREDRTRLRCCSSGCFVCMQELLKIVAEVEAAEGIDKTAITDVAGCVKAAAQTEDSSTPP
jgi:hypothetical protein